MHIEHEIKQKFNTMLILDPHFMLFIQKEKKKEVDLFSFSLRKIDKLLWRLALRLSY